MTSRAAAVAGLAGLLANETRAAICLALLDGRAWTVGELARHVGVAASTGTGHADLLVQAGILAEVHQGRHRYLRLADASTAEVIEQLAGAVAEPAGPMTLRASQRAERLRRARVCYDHLAGLLGVALYQALRQRDLITDGAGLAVTTAGREWCAVRLGRLLGATRRAPVRQCLDWTERLPHLGGELGAALLDWLEREGGIERGPDRAVRLTAVGAALLTAELGLDLE